MKRLGRPRKIESAKKWLLWALSDGPKCSTAILIVGEYEGFSKSTLDRAKKKLGIVSRCFRVNGHVKYYKWALPGSQQSSFAG